MKNPNAIQIRVLDELTPDAQCVTCRFSNCPAGDLIEDHVVFIECRRHAPTPTPWATTGWASVRTYDWCGEYSPRETT